MFLAFSGTVEPVVSGHPWDQYVWPPYARGWSFVQD